MSLSMNTQHRTNILAAVLTRCLNLCRHGRTAHTCDEMQCELVDAQLRAVGDYLDSFDDFFLSLPGIILGAFSTIGK